MPTSHCLLLLLLPPVAPAELVGYAGSVYLSVAKLQKLVAQEASLRDALTKLLKVRGGPKRSLHPCHLACCHCA